MVPFAFVQSPKSGFLITSLRFRKMDWVFASHSPDLDIIRKKKTKTKKQAAPSSTPQLIPLHVLTGCTCKIVGFENGEGKAVKDNFTFLLLRKYFVKKKIAYKLKFNEFNEFRVLAREDEKFIFDFKISVIRVYWGTG